MQRISFNNTYMFTAAVLSREKTQYRKVFDAKDMPPYKDYEMEFHFAEDENDPMLSVFRWANKKKRSEHTPWIYSRYSEGEFVAVTQSYKTLVETTHDIKDEELIQKLKSSFGWRNNSIVRTDLMPWQIQITRIRVQRLQDISEKDCLAEGIRKRPDGLYAVGNGLLAVGKGSKRRAYFSTPQEAFAALVDRVEGKGTWNSNPFVFVYDFKLFKASAV